MAPLERSDQDNSPSNNAVIRLLRAETILARVLKTLDADYTKIQVRNITFHNQIQERNINIL